MACFEGISGQAGTSQMKPDMVYFANVCFSSIADQREGYKATV